MRRVGGSGRACPIARCGARWGRHWLPWLALPLAGACGLLHPDDRGGCSAARRAERPALPLLEAPFAGGFPVMNYFDHAYPGAAEEGNGYQLAFCGEHVAGFVDGHTGYDWAMPTGTPLVAALAGKVVWAGLEQPFFCAALGGEVAALVVQIRAAAPSGQVFVVGYAHLDRIDVRVGDSVQAGAALGTAGSTGCSTEPHLHFDVWRRVDDGGGGRFALVDPYGWQASAADPWEAHPQGTTSEWLWADGAAPGLR